MSRPHRSYRLVSSLSAFAIGGIGLAGWISQDPADDPADVEGSINPRWLERLDKLDRALLDANVGFAPPPIDDTMDLASIGIDTLSWDDLRGKVVVLQSWTSRSEAGRSAPGRAQKAMEGADPNSVLLIAIHTPEGADTAETFLERRPLAGPVVVDRTGRLLDELGIYRRPANIVIDRNGTVRYAGLTAQGLAGAVALLVTEDFDPNKKPAQREQAAPAESKQVAFPADVGSGGSARNVRGQRAPDFHVQQWLNGQPDATGKVVMVEFWATW